MPARPPRRVPTADSGPRELLLDVADHFVWARAIARGVRRDAGFRAGSVEELDTGGDSASHPGRPHAALRRIEIEAR